jgi:hypothetical protein
MSGPVSRRTVLRGLGSAVALPWLEAMTPRSAMAAAAATPPTRMAVIYVPNGIVTRRLLDGNVLESSWAPSGRLEWALGNGNTTVPAWTPDEVGTLPAALPSLLEPLKDMRGDFSIVTGLANAPGRAGVGHGPAQAAFVTCARQIPTAGPDHRSGTSVDQVAANHAGDRTRLSSLQIGDQGHVIENCHTALSWRDAVTPLPSLGNPRHIFDRLFATDATPSGGRREFERQSVLDFIRDDAGSLRLKLGANDRRKLDEYFAAIRDVEQRIERNAAMPPPKAPEGVAAPDDRQPTWADRIRLLADMLVLAFQTDSTRLCTFGFALEFSGASYPYAGINEGHHLVSHHGGNANHIAACTQINLHMLEQFAYLLRRLKETKEVEGPLLDSCMIAYGSGNGDGLVHSKSNLPILLAGRGGGLKPGRHLGFAEETPLANLWLTLLDRFDVHVDRFGDSTGQLEGL